jgi:hypothetical protein
MAFQTGVTTLESGQTTCGVSFPQAFTSSDLRIFLEVYDSAGSADPTLINAQVTSRTTSGFTAKLSAAPPTSSYRLSWLAGSEDTNFVAPSPPSGIGYESLPLYTSPSLSDAATLPVVVPGSPSTTNRISWGNLKQFSGNSHSHTIDQISGINDGARNALKASTVSGTLTLLGGAPTVHTHTVSQLSNASNLAKNILVATDAITIRELIDAAPASHEHEIDDILGVTVVGEALLTATDAETARAAIGAIGDDYTPGAESLDIEEFLKDFLLSTSPDEARQEIGALTNNRFSGVVTLASGASIHTQAGDKILLVSSPSPFTLVIGGADTAYERYVAVASGTTVNISLQGGVALLTERGTDAVGVPVGGTLLQTGFYRFVSAGNGIVYLTNRFGLFGRQLLNTDNAPAARSIIDYNVDNLPGFTTTGLNLAKATSVGAVKTSLAITTSDVSGISVYVLDNILGQTSRTNLLTHLALTVGNIIDMSANGRSLTQAANYAAMKSLLSIVPLDIVGSGSTGRALLAAPTASIARATLGITESGSSTGLLTIRSISTDGVEPYYDLGSPETLHNNVFRLFDGTDTLPFDYFFGVPYGKPEGSSFYIINQTSTTVIELQSQSADPIPVTISPGSAEFINPGQAVKVIYLDEGEVFVLPYSY